MGSDSLLFLCLVCLCLVVASGLMFYFGDCLAVFLVAFFVFTVSAPLLFFLLFKWLNECSSLEHENFM